jgi:hypothetical protein
MDRRILKYKLAATPAILQRVALTGAYGVALSVGMQDHGLVVWVSEDVTPTKERGYLDLMLVRTGQAPPDGRFIGTVVSGIVWHLWEVTA